MQKLRVTAAALLLSGSAALAQGSVLCLDAVCNNCADPSTQLLVGGVGLMGAAVNGYQCPAKTWDDFVANGDNAALHWYWLKDGPRLDSVVDLTGRVSGGGCTAALSCPGGTCPEPTVSGGDICLQHDDRDFEFHVFPDDPHMLSTGNMWGTWSGGTPGDIGVEWEWMYMFPTLRSKDHPFTTSPALKEFTRDYLPIAVPTRGDRIALRGRHVLDCGEYDQDHGGARAEIHPPVAMAWMHEDDVFAPGATSQHYGTVWLHAASRFTNPGENSLWPKDETGKYVPFTAVLPMPGPAEGQTAYAFPLVTDWAIDPEGVLAHSLPNYPQGIQLTVCNGETVCTGPTSLFLQTYELFNPPWTIIPFYSCALQIDCDFNHPWAHIGRALDCALDPTATYRPATNYFNIAITPSAGQLRVDMAPLWTPNHYLPNLIGAHIRVCSPECSSEGAVLNYCPGACKPGLAPTPHAPVGNLDLADQFGTTISGWAVDPDLPPGQQIQVHVYFDGPSNGGGVGFTTVAGVPRGDANAQGFVGDHGFSLPVPLQYRDGYQHYAWAYGISATSHPDTDLPYGPVSFTYKLPVGTFDGVTNLVASGWAFDPKTPATSIPVHIYIDGAFFAAVSANQASADVDAAYGIPGAHRFSVALPSSYASSWGNHTVVAYAIDTGGGVNPSIGSKVICYPQCPATIQRCSGSGIANGCGGVCPCYQPPPPPCTSCSTQ